LRVFPTGSGKFAGDFPDGFSPGKSNAIAEEDGRKKRKIPKYPKFSRTRNFGSSRLEDVSFKAQFAMRVQKMF